MTAPEMRSEFLVSYDKLASQGAPGYRNWQISIFLTRAQEIILKSRLNPKGNRYGNVVDETEKRKKDFAQIVTPGVCTLSSSQVGAFPDGYLFDLPSTPAVMYVLHERIVTNIIDCSITDRTAYKVARVKPIAYDYYNANIDNPHKKPSIEVCWRLDVQAVTPVGVGATAKRHMIITDGTYQVSTYNITYIRKPRPIIVETLPSGRTIDGYTNTAGVLDCELNEEIHREIVELAVKLASGAVKDAEGYQIHTIESEKTE